MCQKKVQINFDKKKCSKKIDVWIRVDMFPKSRVCTFESHVTAYTNVQTRKMNNNKYLDDLYIVNTRYTYCTYVQTYLSIDYLHVFSPTETSEIASTLSCCTKFSTNTCISVFRLHGLSPYFSFYRDTLDGRRTIVTISL